MKIKKGYLVRINEITEKERKIHPMATPDMISKIGKITRVVNVSEYDKYSICKLEIDSGCYNWKDNWLTPVERCV